MDIVVSSSKGAAQLQKKIKNEPLILCVTETVNKPKQNWMGLPGDLNIDTDMLRTARARQALTRVVKLSVGK